MVLEQPDIHIQKHNDNMDTDHMREWIIQLNVKCNTEISRR